MDADLPGPSSFDAATRLVTRGRWASSCGAARDVQELVEEIRPFVDGGSTEVALLPAL